MDIFKTVCVFVDPLLNSPWKESLTTFCFSMKNLSALFVLVILNMSQNIELKEHC